MDFAASWLGTAVLNIPPFSDFSFLPSNCRLISPRIWHTLDIHPGIHPIFTKAMPFFTLFSGQLSIFRLQQLVQWDAVASPEASLDAPTPDSWSKCPSRQAARGATEPPTSCMDWCRSDAPQMGGFSRFSHGWTLA